MIEKNFILAAINIHNRHISLTISLNAATDLGFKASPLVFVIIKVYKVNFSLFP